MASKAVSSSRQSPLVVVVVVVVLPVAEGLQGVAAALNGRCCTLAAAWLPLPVGSCLSVDKGWPDALLPLPLAARVRATRLDSSNPTLRS